MTPSCIMRGKVSTPTTRQRDPAPWVPGAPTVWLGNMPALDNTSTLMGTWGGIQIMTPGPCTEQRP